MSRLLLTLTVLLAALAASPPPAPAGGTVAPAAIERFGVRFAAAAAAQDRAHDAWRREQLRRMRRSRTVRGALRRAWLAGALTRPEHDAHRRTLRAAERAARGLSGVRGAEQRAALATIVGLAARGELRVGRLTAAMLTLRRNTAWWTRRGVPSGDVSWGTDPATLRYKPGRGLVLHHLASWGRVNALAGGCLARPADCDRDRLRGALDRLVALGGRRHGFLAWEHLFGWAQGRPGWVSAMVQATAIQALARGSEVLGDRRYVRVARRALGAFERRPPVGVAVPAAGGRHYVMYSFDPSLRVVNGFLQSLVGLRDFAELTGSRRAARLYARGERAARRAVRRADTGAWSRYSTGGRESTLHYHRLTATFLAELCRRTGRGRYCATRRRFARYEREPTRITLRPPSRPRARERERISFWISKVSQVVVEVRGPRGVELRRTVGLPRGRHVVAWRPARKGRAVVRVLAQGPSGPRGAATEGLRVHRSWAEVARTRARRLAAERRARARRRAAERRERAERRARAERRERAERQARERDRAEAETEKRSADPSDTDPAVPAPSP